MIELYLAIALFGVGSFLNNKKNTDRDKKEKKVADKKEAQKRRENRKEEG